MSRDFVPGQGLSCEVSNLFCSNIFDTVFEPNHCGDLCSPLFVCSADNGYFSYCRMSIDCVLDFARCYEDAAGIDNVFAPVHNFNVAILIQNNQIARTEPTAHKSVGGL